MKSQSFRTLETIDGKQYVFSSKMFKEYCNRYISEETSRTGVKAKKKDLWEKLAEETSVSSDSIHAWHCGSNGPGDVSYVKIMANILGVDYKKLMEEVPDEKNNMITPLREALNDNSREYTEKEMITKVYQLILDQDRNLERMRYFDFFDEMLEFLSKHALEVSGDTYRRLCNILMEYCQHLDFEGCSRWEAISTEYGVSCWAAAEMYRDEGWFDEDEEDEWTETIYKQIADEMEPVFLIKYATNPTWHGHFIGNPDDKEELRKLAQEEIKDYDGSDVTAKWEDIDIDGLISRIFDKKRMYFWMFSKMLMDVFKYDFPQYFSDEKGEA